jgi:hypothetical protein
VHTTPGGIPIATLPSSPSSPARSGSRAFLSTPWTPGTAAAVEVVPLTVARPALIRSGAQRRIVVDCDTDEEDGEEEYIDQFNSSPTARNHRRTDALTANTVEEDGYQPPGGSDAGADVAISRRTAQSLAGVRAYRTLESRRRRPPAAATTAVSLFTSRSTGRRNPEQLTVPVPVPAPIPGSIPTSARSVQSTDDISDAVVATASSSRRGQLVSHVYSPDTLRAQVIYHSAVSDGLPRVLATQYNFPQAEAVPLSGRSDQSGSLITTLPVPTAVPAAAAMTSPVYSSAGRGDRGSGPDRNRGYISSTSPLSSTPLRSRLP